MKANAKDMKHLTNNKHTRTVVEYVGNCLEISNTYMAPQFFHQSHNYVDRQLLVIVLGETLRDIYPNLTIERIGNDSVVIKKN